VDVEKRQSAGGLTVNGGGKLTNLLLLNNKVTANKLPDRTY